MTTGLCSNEIETSTTLIGKLSSGAYGPSRTSDSFSFDTFSVTILALIEVRVIRIILVST